MFFRPLSLSYILPTKTTEVMLMQEQGTKMFVDAVLKTHERVVQVRMFELPSASPEGGSARPPA